MAGTNLDYALNYIRNFGFAVFPVHSVKDGKCTCGIASCKNPGKHPIGSLTPKGCLDASKDEAQIKYWFENEPNRNIGIATGRISNLIVLDVDIAKGAKIEDLGFADDAAVFTTPKVKTGGGFHFYYKYPADVVIKNSNGKLADHIDVRGDGGYVVAPPSKHVSGNAYEFLTKDAALLEFPAIAPATNGGGILAGLAGLKFTRGSQNGNKDAADASNEQNGHTPGLTNGLHVTPFSALIMPEEIQQGKRNSELTKIAGSLRRLGLSEGAILSALKVENQRICKPPVDDSEVNQIARSVGRYRPHDALDPVADDDGSVDYENTLKAYELGEFLDTKFEELEVLSFHISKTEIGIIQAPTNAGKTTILRNAALAMACGRPFPPFFDGHRPIRIAYFDFESSAQRAQPDLAQMIDALTPDEQKLARKNIAYIPKGMRNGELFQFNTGEDWVQYLLTNNNIEFVFVDNVSAAYDLNDENSNAEVNRKVIKPLLKLAYKGDCAFLFAHHYGKGKTELEHAGVHAGRGASNLQSLSQTVINMFGNVSKGEPITIECAKRKTDGGKDYRQVFELKEDRWFHPTLMVPPPKPQTCAETISEYINDNIIYPDTVTPADLADLYDGVFGLDMINKTLAMLANNGFIAKQGRGEYCARKKKKTDSKPIKSYYEKDTNQD